MGSDIKKAEKPETSRNSVFIQAIFR
jgi:hypothetical protein